MSLTRRSLTLGTVAGAAAATLAPEGLLPQALAATGSSSESPQVVLDWERIVFRTVYTDAATPIPVGVPVLGLRLRGDAPCGDQVGPCRLPARRRPPSRPRPTTSSCTTTRPSRRCWRPTWRPASPGSVRLRAARARGSGPAAAADMLASRVGDHYLDPSFHYSKAPGPGVWQPNPGSTDMLAPWLGSLRPLFVDARCPWPGPYALDLGRLRGGVRRGTSPRLRVLRRAHTGADRHRACSSTATRPRWSSDALVRHLEAHPLDLLATTRLFAMIHGAMTDSAIRCWGLKRDVGFWRPSQAVAGADTDGNDATPSPRPGWAPLVPEPELLRLRQRSCRPDRSGRRGDPAHARRGHRARAPSR